MTVSYHIPHSVSHSLFTITLPFDVTCSGLLAPLLNKPQTSKTNR